MSKVRLARKMREAADYGDSHGWTHRKFRSLGGGVCAVQALRSSKGGGANAAWKHLDRRCAGLYGGIGDPNVAVGLVGAHDAKLTKGGTGRFLRREADRLDGKRQGVRRQAQKDAKAAQAQADRQAKAAAAKDARQHPCAGSASGSGSRTGAHRVLAGVAVVAVIVMAVHLVVPMLAAFVATLMFYVLAILEAAAVAAGVIAGGVGVYLGVTRPDWGHVKVWRAQRAALARRRSEVAALADQPIALPYRAPVSADDVLKTDWTVRDRARDEATKVKAFGRRGR